MYTNIFLHAKPWIPGGENLVFTVVIHYLRSLLRQFAHARTIDKYDVTIPVPHVHVMSQINCGDVTMLIQKRMSLAATAKPAMDIFCVIVCSEHNKANLRDLIAATGLLISNWIQIVNFSAHVTVKFDGWPCKTIGHLFYATSSFVHLFVPIGEFKLKLQSWNAQSGSNWMIFRAVRPWNLTDDLAKQ